jgi:hypothetical protein
MFTKVNAQKITVQQKRHKFSAMYISSKINTNFGRLIRSMTDSDGMIVDGMF